MHSFLERTQLEHAGRFSSHLILRNLAVKGSLASCSCFQATNLHALMHQFSAPARHCTYLQLLQPVLTFGLLVLARFGLCKASSAVSFIADIAIMSDERLEN